MLFWHFCASTLLKAGRSGFKSSGLKRLIPQVSASSLFFLCSLRRAQHPALGLKVEVVDEGRPQSEVALKVSCVCGVLGSALGVHAVNGDCCLQVM